MGLARRSDQSRHPALLCAVSALFVAAAATAQEATPPTSAALAARLRDPTHSVTQGEGYMTQVCIRSPTEPATGLPLRETPPAAAGPDDVRVSMLSCYYCQDGVREFVEAWDSAVPIVEPRRARYWSPGDGTRHTLIQSQSGRPPDQGMVLEEEPWDLLGTRARSHLVGALEAGSAHVAALDERGGLECIRVELTEALPGSDPPRDWQRTFWLAASRGYGVAREEARWVDPSLGFEALSVMTVPQFVEVSDGCWLPAVTETHYFRRSVGADVWRWSMTRLQIRRDIKGSIPGPGVFTPRMPNGTVVTEMDGSHRVVGDDVAALAAALQAGELPVPLPPTPADVR